jgi:hypothetical protein
VPKDCKGKCGRKISRQNKTGYCKECFGRLILSPKGADASRRDTSCKGVSARKDNQEQIWLRYKALRDSKVLSPLLYVLGIGGFIDSSAGFLGV